MMDILDKIDEARKKLKLKKLKPKKFGKKPARPRVGQKKKPPKKDITDRCTCEEFYHESHSCPYEEDVNNNPNDDYCQCCPYCYEECAWNI
jgi:hypothetical protein